jgi:hypothetical protein
MKSNKEIFNWIEKVIDSCETESQCKTAKNLVENFANKLMFEKTNEHYLFIEPLNKLCRKKLTKVTN